MPAVAFTAFSLGDLQAPPGHSNDISARELATFIAVVRPPFTKTPDGGLTCSGSGEINVAGGRAGTP